MQNKKIKEFIKSIKRNYPQNTVDRWYLILTERAKGKSYREIGFGLNISRQRVAQVDKFLISKMEKLCTQAVDTKK